MIERTTLFKLLLVQMVYEKGELFHEIAPELNKHRLLKKERAPATNTNECRQLYDDLLVENDLQRTDDYEVGQIPAKRPTWVASLARILYENYTEELLQLIQQDEKDFKEAFESLEQKKAGEV
jgi:hypothetical protein